ncbi:putative adipose-regulatory protein-domain-containing protein [Massariosphaeria phaeospora]|uniref:Putative adipose-regulatory protein-domain-containing protein n=1 Tax=Massariosphaeria phaeospora TaxID=100035 RepID=A0A7C8I6T7_9PLEO|nr:putative adipose-regulatory protein-domain-containing protein [Massariosphaeria phaeospora]
MNEATEGHNEQDNIVQHIKDTLLAPVRIAISPTFLRTYLRAILIFVTSAILFAIAVIAYSSFYFAYIPIRGITVPVYLQFDAAHTESDCAAGKFPYGLANINGLVSRQKYDVVVDMVMPRSTKNLDAGNWMVVVEMRAPVPAAAGIKGMLGWGEEWEAEDHLQDSAAGVEKESVQAAGDARPEGILSTNVKPLVLARSKRPALLTYRSWMTESVFRALRLPFYILSWRHESEKVSTVMMEAVRFEKGWRNVPSSLRLEVRSKTPLDVYKVAVRFVARLEGLRYIMYTYRLSSFVVFTGMFWGVEMGLVLSTWLVFTLLFGGSTEQPEAEKSTDKKTIKNEDANPTPTPKPERAPSESDTSRTFPTLPSQKPLHYTPAATLSSSDAQVKDERQTLGLEDVPVKEEEADDEDEDADFVIEESGITGSSANVWEDSGIGTSMESSSERAEGGGLGRRRSRGGGGGGGGKRYP